MFSGISSIDVRAWNTWERTVIVFDLVYFDVTVLVVVIVSVIVLYFVDSTIGVVVADTVIVGVY